MQYKPLVSLVVAFVATSSVAASATPIRRGVGGLGPGYGPNPPAIPASQCGSGNLQCCNGSGANCDDTFNILGGGKCENQMFCCDPTTKNTGIAIQCIPVIVNL